MNEIKQINKFFLIIILVNIVFGSFFTTIMPKSYLVVTQIAFLVIPAIIFIRYKKLNFIETFNLKKFSIVNIPLVLMLTILMQYPLAAVSDLTGYFFGDQLGFIFDDIVSSSSFFLLFISIVVSPAICEELLFRGLIFNRYKNRVSIKTLIVMNGLLFGIFHLNVQQFSYAFIFGVIASLVVYLTDSIYPAMIMHFVNNFLSIVEMKFPESYFSALDYLMFKGEGIFYIGVTIILSILASIMIYVVLKYMAKFNGRSLIDYGVCEKLTSVKLNFDEYQKENIIDLMNKFEYAEFNSSAESNDETVITAHRFLKIEEVFSWHITVAVLIFIVFSVLIAFSTSIF